MKKLTYASLLGLSLIASTAFATTTTPPSETGVAVINNTSTTAVAHIYDANNLIIGSLYVPANGNSNTEPHKTYTNLLYAGISSVSASGDVDHLYTSCFHRDVFSNIYLFNKPKQQSISFNITTKLYFKYRG